MPARFDSASCFTALLGEEKHGRWLISPAGEVRSVSRRYREGTLVLETDFETADGSARVIDFMPPHDGGAPQLMPCRAGYQTLTLCVSLRVDSPVVTGGRIAVPVLEREIRIQVDIGFSARRFLASNWQWLIATIVGLGGCHGR